MKHTIDYSTVPRTEAIASPRVAPPRPPSFRSAPPREPPFRAAMPSGPPFRAVPASEPLREAPHPPSAEARPSPSVLPTPARASSMPSPGLVTTELVLPTTTRQRLARVSVLAATAFAASVLIVGLRGAPNVSSVAAGPAPHPAALVEPTSVVLAAGEPQALMPIVTSLERLPEPQPARVIEAASVVIEASVAVRPAVAAPPQQVGLPQPVRPVRRQNGLSVHDFADPLPASLSRGVPANPYE